MALCPTCHADVQNLLGLEDNGCIAAVGLLIGLTLISVLPLFLFLFFKNHNKCRRVSIRSRCDLNLGQKKLCRAGAELQHNQRLEMRNGNQQPVSDEAWLR